MRDLHLGNLTPGLHQGQVHYSTVMSQSGNTGMAPEMGGWLHANGNYRNRLNSHQHKCGKLRKVITHSVIWANQKTEPFAFP